MSNSIKWNSVSTGGGDTDGLNNAMVEHFVGNYNYFLAREIIQNSLDAKKRGLTEDLPVEVSFQLKYLNSADFPGYSELLDIFNKAKEYWKHHEETVNFLINGIACLTKDKIPFLWISDYNTTGLTGNDSDMQGGWFNLVRSTGSSFKSHGEGGAFGIGKGAPFAASELRTVFYATKNENEVSIFQGKAELVSFKFDDDTKRGVCSYGIQHGSVRDPKLIPKGFWRKEHGTDIVVAGYRVANDWEEDLLKSILRNFWYAIHCNDLKVQVKDIHINSNNLSEYLVKYFANEQFKDHVEPIGNPLQYYLTVVEGEQLGKEEKLKTLGHCKFYFKQTEAHLNYVAMLRRSHMVIYSRRFVFPGNFAGVFICDDEKGNAALRKMEPPAHDKWDPKRNKENGEAVMSELTNFIRGCIESIKQRKSYGVLSIPTLQKYLPFDEGDEEGEGEGENMYTGNEGKEETAKQVQMKETLAGHGIVLPYKVAVLNYKTSGGNEAGTGIRNGSGNTIKTKKGGGGGTNKSIKVKDMHCRSYLVSRSKDSAIYRLVLKNPTDLKCNLVLTAVGEDVEDKVSIKSATSSDNSEIKFAGNKIQYINLDSGITKTIDVTIDSPFKIALKVTAHDLQQ